MERIWWFLPVLGLAVLFAAVFRWSVQKQTESAVRSATATTLIGPPDPAAIDLGVLADPFFSEPCFFSGSQTCQLSFYPNGTDTAVRLAGSRLVQPQQPQDLRFLTSRMLTQPSQLSLRFRQEIVDQTDPNPFFVSVIQSIRAGLMYDINPALLFTYYDLLLSSAENLGVEIPVVEGELQPRAEDIALAIVAAKESESLAGESWTKAGKIILQASAGLLPPALVMEMLGEEGELERRYLALFAPPESEGTYEVLYSESSVTVEQVFGPDDEGEFRPYFTALCRNLQANVCRMEGRRLLCSRSPQYDFLCPGYLLSL